MDINSFAQLAVGTYGNCPYNNVRGPGFKSMNASVFRSFPWGDRRIEFRLETFNTLNRPIWNDPNTTVTSPLYGTINSTRKPMLEVQLGLKFVF